MPILTILAATLLAPPVSAQRVEPSPRPFERGALPARCKPTAGMVDSRRDRPKSGKLGDQPPATHFYAVYNLVDNCPQPVVLRKGIGANADRPAPVVRVPPRMTRVK